MFQRLPIVTKNIIIINVIIWLACFVSEPLRFWLTGYFFQSENFKPWQVITHMFMHANYDGGHRVQITHILFNMFGVFMFGSALEYRWGAKRFLNYYLLCGLGAFLLHQTIAYIEVQQLLKAFDGDTMNLILTEGAAAIREGKNYVEPDLAKLNGIVNVGLVGASGCLFGLLLAYGMIFPNQELMMMFIPIPIKAKYFVMLYGAMELLLALRNSPTDNVAHYAHLGGMLFGYIILKVWQKQGKLN